MKRNENGRMEVKLTGGGGKREGGVSSLSLCYAPHDKYDAANGKAANVLNINWLIWSIV